MMLRKSNIFITVFATLLLEIYNVKTPEYLSITSDSNSYRSLIYDFIVTNLRKLAQTHSDDERIKNDLTDIISLSHLKFKEPDSWHITCLYIGNNETALNDSIYKNFEERVQVNFFFSNMIYIPGKILTAAVFPNYSLIHNKFPHVTLLLGEYKAVDSNYVLKSIFDNNEQMKLLYLNGSMKNRDYLINVNLDNVNIKFDSTGREEVVPRIYVIKSNAYLDLIGFTTKNYK